MTSDGELCESLVAHDQVSGAVVNVAPRHTRKRSHHAKPRSEGGPQMVGFIADALREEAAVQSRLVDRALATQLHAFLLVATRFVLMGVLWMTWQLQSLGTAASSLARVGAVKWLGGRLLVRQLGVTLRSCIVSWWTLQRARQLYSMTVWVWMVCRERTSAFRVCITTQECVAFFRKRRAPVKDLFFCSPGVALLLSMRTWACMSWIPLQQRFRVARPPLSFRTNGQNDSAYTEDSRDLRRQTRKAEDIRGVGAPILGSSFKTPMRLCMFEICRCIAAVAETLVRCMWSEKAQAMMKELYDDGFQHPGRSTLLRARIRQDMSSMLLRRRGSIAIVGIHSFGGRSISALTPPRSLAERFVVWCGGSSWLLSLMPLVLLGYGHGACTDETMVLGLSLWLFCCYGASKTFEDVLLSIRSITTDMGVEAWIPSIDNVLSRFAAVVRRSDLGTFQAYSRFLPQCVRVHITFGLQ